MRRKWKICVFQSECNIYGWIGGFLKLNSFVTESLIRVRYQETDQMQVVYHANYLVWFEIGRTDYIRHFGLTYQKLEEQGLFLPVVDLKCRYLQPAQYDDEVLIFTKVFEVTGSKLVFRYQAKGKHDQQLLAKGETTHLWTNQQMKRVHLHRENPELYKRLQSVAEKIRR